MKKLIIRRKDKKSINWNKIFKKYFDLSDNIKLNALLDCIIQLKLVPPLELEIKEVNAEYDESFIIVEKK